MPPQPFDPNQVPRRVANEARRRSAMQGWPAAPTVPLGPPLRPPGQPVAGPAVVPTDRQALNYRLREDPANSRALTPTAIGQPRPQGPPSTATAAPAPIRPPGRPVVGPAVVPTDRQQLNSRLRADPANSRPAAATAVAQPRPQGPPSTVTAAPPPALTTGGQPPPVLPPAAGPAPVAGPAPGRPIAPVERSMGAMSREYRANGAGIGPNGGPLPPPEALPPFSPAAPTVPGPAAPRTAPAGPGGASFPPDLFSDSGRALTDEQYLAAGNRQFGGPRPAARPTIVGGRPTVGGPFAPAPAFPDAGPAPVAAPTVGPEAPMVPYDGRFDPAPTVGPAAPMTRYDGRLDRPNQAPAGPMGARVGPMPEVNPSQMVRSYERTVAPASPFIGPPGSIRVGDATPGRPGLPARPGSPPPTPTPTPTPAPRTTPAGEAFSAYESGAATPPTTTTSPAARAFAEMADEGIAARTADRGRLNRALTNSMGLIGDEGGSLLGSLGRGLWQGAKSLGKGLVLNDFVTEGINKLNEHDTPSSGAVGRPDQDPMSRKLDLEGLATRERNPTFIGGALGLTAGGPGQVQGKIPDAPVSGSPVDPTNLPASLAMNPTGTLSAMVGGPSPGQSIDQWRATQAAIPNQYSASRNPLYNALNGQPATALEQFGLGGVNEFFGGTRPSWATAPAVPEAGPTPAVPAAPAPTPATPTPASPAGPQTGVAGVQAASPAGSVSRFVTLPGGGVMLNPDHPDNAQDSPARGAMAGSGTTAAPTAAPAVPAAPPVPAVPAPQTANDWARQDYTRQYDAAMASIKAAQAAGMSLNDVAIGKLLPGEATPAWMKDHPDASPHSAYINPYQPDRGNARSDNLKLTAKIAQNALGYANHQIVDPHAPTPTPVASQDPIRDQLVARINQAHQLHQRSLGWQVNAPSGADTREAHAWIAHQQQQAQAGHQAALDSLVHYDSGRSRNDAARMGAESDRIQANAAAEKASGVAQQRANDAVLGSVPATAMHLMDENNLPPEVAFPQAERLVQKHLEGRRVAGLTPEARERERTNVRNHPDWALAPSGKQADESSLNFVQRLMRTFGMQ